MHQTYLEGVIKLFSYYKTLGEGTINQLSTQDLFWQYNESSNSIAIIIQHIAGNMLSRWSDFLNSDGEKPWRNRDAEFEIQILNKATLMKNWDEGWHYLLNTLKSLQPYDLEKIVYIRNEGHTVIDAINRQLAHYPYHIGQIVYIGKMLKDQQWQSLSIPKGNSAMYNAAKFNKDKQNIHFTDGLLQENSVNDKQ